jgi:hypothetical protein
VKKSKVTIENFLEEFNWEIREIIDNISGEIVQEFPNVKEKISNSKIIYKDVNHGNFLELKVINNIVIISNLKNKTSKKYSKPQEIDLEELKKLYDKS